MFVCYTSCKIIVLRKFTGFTTKPIHKLNSKFTEKLIHCPRPYIIDEEEFQQIVFREDEKLETYQNEILKYIPQNKDLDIIFFNQNILAIKESHIHIIDEKKLPQIVSQAEENRNLIHKATVEYRDFLKKEFSFKESF